VAQALADRRGEIVGTVVREFAAQRVPMVAPGSCTSLVGGPVSMANEHGLMYPPHRAEVGL